MASKQDLDRKHAEALSKLAARRDAAVAAAEQAAHEARGEHDREADALREQHAAETEKRHSGSQAAFHKLMSPMIASWKLDDSRKAALAIASQYRALNDRHVEATGRELSEWDLASVFADQLVSERPECLGALVSPDARRYSMPASAVGHAGTTFHRDAVSGADASSLKESLLALESAVARQAASASAAPSDAAARWDILRFGGSPAAIAAKLAALDAVAEAAHSAAAHEAAAANRARRDAEAGSPGWEAPPRDIYVGGSLQ